MKADRYLPCMSCIFSCFEVHPGPCFISSMDLAWGLAHLFWNLLAGVHKRYTSKVYDCINLDGSLIKLDTMSYLIKEGYFNQSTILNLKSLWMHLARKTSNPEHTKIKKGSMPLYDQAKLIKIWSWVNCRWTLSYLCTYLSALTSSVCDGSFEVAAAVAWSHMVVEDSTMLMQDETEEALGPCWLRWITRLGHTHD